jgi:hypothetical protein
MDLLGSPNAPSSKGASIPTKFQLVTKREHSGKAKKINIIQFALTGLRYHAHSEVQRADGLYGGLVIHNPTSSEAISYQYDRELLLLVGDWYHWPATKVLDTFMRPTNTGVEVCFSS